MAQHSETHTRWWMILVMLYTVLLGIRGIDAGTLYFDEQATIQHLGTPYILHTFSQVIESVRIRSSQHTLGYFLMMHLWLSLVGYSVAALRYSSVLIGLLAIAGLYRLGRDYFSPHAGLYAATLNGATALYLYYLHEIRMYTLLLLLMICIFWLYLRIIDPQREVKFWQWGGLFVAVAGLIYTHILAVFPLFALGLYHLIWVKKDRRWWLVVSVLVTASLTIVPWLPGILGVAPHQDQMILEPLAPLGVITLMAYLFANGSILLVPILGAGLIVAFWSRHRFVLFITFLTSGMLVALLVGNTIIPLVDINRSRYLLMFWPPLALLAGVGLARLRHRSIVVPLVIVGWLAAGLHFGALPEFQIYTNKVAFGIEPPYQRVLVAFRELNTTPAPTDLLLIVTDDATRIKPMRIIGEYYFNWLKTKGFVVTPHTLGEDHNDPVGHALALDTLAAQPVIWFAYIPDDNYLSQDNMALVKAVLNHTHRYCDTPYAQPDMRIDRYAKQPFGCALMNVPSLPLVRYAALDTALVDIQVSDAIPGQFQVATGWATGETVPPDTYSVSLKVFAAGGKFIAQSDFGLPVGNVGWHLVTFDTHEWVAGIYDLEVTVYAWQTGERVTGSLHNGGAAGSEILVHQFEIQAPPYGDNVDEKIHVGH